MGRRLEVTVQRPHSKPVHATVLDGPSSHQVREAIRRSPHRLARWLLARDRVFLAAADIMHVELMLVPKALGLVYSTDGGLWWDESRQGFRLYVNDPLRESLISTEPAFWRMVRPHPVYVIPPEYRHHHDVPEDAWIELRPDTRPEMAGRREARHEEARVRAWETYGVARLRALVSALPDSVADNYVANLRGKAAEALEAGTPTVWHDGDRMRSHRVDWRCDEAGSYAHMAGRRVAVTWADTFTRHPLYREAMVDHFRVIGVAEAWDDGEALDPVDRIVVEAEICGMMESDGIESIPPEALTARQAAAGAKASSDRADGDAPNTPGAHA